MDSERKRAEYQFYHENISEKHTSQHLTDCALLSYLLLYVLPRTLSASIAALFRVLIVITYHRDVFKALEK